MTAPRLLLRGRSGFVALMKLYLTQWRRSRAPLALLALGVAFCYWDAALIRDGGGPWWTITVMLIAWSGFLLGYDTYERLRFDGSLRLMLTHAEARLTFAMAFVTIASLLAAIVVLLSLGYLVIAGRIPSVWDALPILPIFLLAIGGWVAYAQVMSLLLPRDTAAVLGLLAIFFGSGAYDRWLPQGTPAFLRQVVRVIWESIPTSVRLSEVAAHRDLLRNSGIVTLQLAFAVGVIWVLLHRRNLLSRSEIDA